MVLFEQILDGEQAVRHGVAWECVDDDELVDRAVDYAAKAAAHPVELVAVTKKTLHDTAGVTESVPAVQMEIPPQAWSMKQPAFVEMVGRLKARIAAGD
jgi:enoyl-CoA hydratase